MLGYSFAGKTNIRKMKVDAEGILEETFQIRQKRKQFSILIPTYKKQKKAKFVLKVYTFNFHTTDFISPRYNKSTLIIKSSHLETKTLLKYSKIALFSFLSKTIKCILITSILTAIDTNRGNYGTNENYS